MGTERCHWGPPGLFLLLSILQAAPTPQPSSLATEMLAAHNAVRARVGVSKLAWSSNLEAVAQKWADKLAMDGQFVHQKGSPYGENLFQVEGVKATPDHVVEDWAAESIDYDYRTNRCSSECGHYTQIVWRNTAQVGCAKASNRQREVWVCEYNPPGNIIGRKPY